MKAVMVFLYMVSAAMILTGLYLMVGGPFLWWPWQGYQGWEQYCQVGK
jgi:hypothetical protein